MHRITAVKWAVPHQLLHWSLAGEETCTCLPALISTGSGTPQAWLALAVSCQAAAHPAQRPHTCRSLPASAHRLRPAQGSMAWGLGGFRSWIAPHTPPDCLGSSLVRLGGLQELAAQVVSCCLTRSALCRSLPASARGPPRARGSMAWGPGCPTAPSTAARMRGWTSPWAQARHAPATEVLQAAAEHSIGAASQWSWALPAVGSMQSRQAPF